MGGLPGFPREDRAYGRVAEGLCSIRNLVETREGVNCNNIERGIHIKTVWHFSKATVPAALKEAMKIDRFGKLVRATTWHLYGATDIFALCLTVFFPFGCVRGANLLTKTMPRFLVEQILSTAGMSATNARFCIGMTGPLIEPPRFQPLLVIFPTDQASVISDAHLPSKVPRPLACRSSAQDERPTHDLNSK